VPVKYDISSVNDYAAACNYCGGTGYQNVQGVGYRTCAYCVTGYKVAGCPSCHGSGCTSCMGTKHEFHSELSSDARMSLPDAPTRPFAGEARPAPSRILPRR
jgi:hypothetical protein